MAKAPKAIKTPSDEIVLVNAGLSARLIRIDEEFVRILPDEEITVDAEFLKMDSIRAGISEGHYVIKDNSDLTKEIAEAYNAKMKPDPLMGKSREQLEDGGEYK